MGLQEEEAVGTALAIKAQVHTHRFAGAGRRDVGVIALRHVVAIHRRPTEILVLHVVGRYLVLGAVGIAKHVLVGARHLPHAGLHAVNGRGNAADGKLLRALHAVTEGSVGDGGGAGGPPGHLPIYDEAVHRGARVDGLGEIELVVAAVVTVVGEGHAREVGAGHLGAQHRRVAAYRSRGLADAEQAGVVGEMALDNRAVLVPVVVVEVHHFNMVARHGVVVGSGIVGELHVAAVLVEVGILIVEVAHAVAVAAVGGHDGAGIGVARLEDSARERGVGPRALTSLR